MNIEPSTLNVLLTAILTLQGWQVREIFRLKERITLLISQCPRCHDHDANN